MIDPDDGENVQRKLKGTASIHNTYDAFLLPSIPPANDPQWTKTLYKAPKVTFGTIFKFLVDRKVLLKKTAYVENISEKRESYAINKVGERIGSYTRTLDKAYRFFQDGHVQNVRFHPMTNKPNYVCIGADVLPSTKKGKYGVWVVLSEHNSCVEKAFCICPAGFLVAVTIDSNLVLCGRILSFEAE